MMRTTHFLGTLLAGLGLVVMGCATTGGRTDALHEAAEPAYSLRTIGDGMTVDVSPAGSTIRFGGWVGRAVGTTVDVTVDTRHRRRVAEVLDDLDTDAVVDERFAAALETALDGRINRVVPLGSIAGYHHARDAQQARLEGLHRSGYDAVLDVGVQYGLYGPETLFAMQTVVQLYDTATGRRHWRDTLLVVPGPALADERLLEVTSRVGFGTDRVVPNFRGGLTVNPEAVDEWYEDDPDLLRNRFEEALDLSIAALLSALQLEESPLGEYALARNAMAARNRDEADELFARALVLDPDFIEARLARAVNAGKDGRVDEAIALTEALLDDHPDYGPALRNLAWWHAVSNRDPAAARPYYNQALALGMRPSRSIERVLERE